MKSNLKNKLNVYLVIFSLVICTSFLYACNPIQDVKADPILSEDPKDLVPDEVVKARDHALAFLVQHQIPNAPSLDLEWTGKNTTTPGVIGGSQFEFLSNDWQIRIAFPIVAPDAVIYTVTISNSINGFEWQGEVNAEGVVLELVPEPVHEPMVKQDGVYRNETHNIAFSYPSGWSLSEYGIEPTEAKNVPPSQVVELTTGSYKIKIHMKNIADLTVIGGGLGAGEIQKDGSITILGQTVERNKLVYEDKTKLVWYGLEDKEVYIFIRIESIDQTDYANIDIAESVISEVDNMLESFAWIKESETTDVETSSQLQTSSASTDGIVVDGWVGVIISTPDLPQIDDYFQMLNQDGNRYGILSHDPDLQAQLVSYRDSEVMIKIWGILFEGRMDAYDTQIEVTRIEELGENKVETSPVEDWVGIIVSNPAEAQFDDFFELIDMEGNRYGIDSLDEAIRQQLIDLRDSGKTIHVWGTLYKNVPDAYGYQIEVTKIDVER